MSAEIVMPRLSDSMEEGTVLRWLVQEGDEVRRGEPLVEIETDKANMTYDADLDGVLAEILAKEGDTLPVGAVIARVNGAGGGKERESPPPATGQEGREEEAGQDEGRPAEQPHAPTPPAPTDDSGERVKASPVARRIAKELHVDLASLEGTGPGGRIVRRDVEEAAEAPREEAPAAAAPAGEAAAPATAPAETGAKGEVTVEEPDRLQRTVARRMAESKATAPDYALEAEVDMTGCVELRGRLREMADPAPSYNDMVVKAAAHALSEHPRVNGAWRDGRYELYSRVNVGVAVATETSLVVPTVFDADRKSLGRIAEELRGLAERVREGTVTPPEVAGGTFTVSNLGMFGIDRFTAILNPPQAALLTVGSLKRRATVTDRGRIVAAPTVWLTLVCDHRIVNGADGARFLARVRELLESPLSLTL